MQFHKGFTFQDAIKIIPYLHALGITHIYASPYLKAVAGSTHGYDVIDHNQLNPEIGDQEDYVAFVAALAARQMSHILDTVPNHMGVETNENRWWNDVLTHGTGSKYANYFDIDWDGFAPRRELRGKVLLAVLGETFSEALKQNLLQLKWQGIDPYIDYHGRNFPIDPKSNKSADLVNLLAEQHYRLSSWKVSADEINYRRFFDISGLAALQMQRLEVFDAAHRFTFELIAKGFVAGLRVDHPDGLLDPEEYFERLAAAAGKSFPVWVEKILNGDEELCEDWPVSGTSGYDFLYAVNDLFVDSANELAMTGIYYEFVGDRTSYADWVYRNKCAVLDGSMYSEMFSLANRLDALAQAELSSRDFTRRQLHDALREVIACFPVYRSYVSSRGVSGQDIVIVEQAVKDAADRNPKIEVSTLKFIQDSVLLRYPVHESVRANQLDFAQRFQQLTSPVNAKGIEDSTFYIYNRLTSLNEVGGDPGRFGRTPEAIHRYFRNRQLRWPAALSSLSTHDTKRSEDVRARLNVLSEIPAEWAEHLKRWQEINSHLCGEVQPNDQYLLYQTLLGAWPLQPMDDSQRAEFLKRICAYMQKAMREAKVHTTWVKPNVKYEAAVACLIEKLLDLGNQSFLSEFLPFQKRIAYSGMVNSLAQTTLRLTAPGISDTYQGSELWDLSLVDPDNRRAVDYELRKSLLATFEQVKAQHAFVQKLMANMEDGGIKLWINCQLLRCRRAWPDLFLKGTYEPLLATGRHAAHLFAFERVWDRQRMIVVVPRLSASLLGNGAWVSVDWDDTAIDLFSNRQTVNVENVITGDRVRPTSAGAVPISQLLQDSPVAVLTCMADTNL